jgi:GNAT superfamily N-acetyltransferase
MSRIADRGIAGILQMEQVTVRVADRTDADRLARLITLAYQVEAFFVEGDRTDREDVLARMQRGVFLVLEETGGLAGCVFVEIGGAVGYFGMLSIDPARQRQGLGARLVAEAERYCRDAGCTTMEIEVVNLRQELPPFYRRLGYAESGTRRFPDTQRATKPCHFIVMEKPLIARR